MFTLFENIICLFTWHILWTTRGSISSFPNVYFRNLFSNEQGAAFYSTSKLWPHHPIFLIVYGESPPWSRRHCFLFLVIQQICFPALHFALLKCIFEFTLFWYLATLLWKGNLPVSWFLLFESTGFQSKFHWILFLTKAKTT